MVDLTEKLALVLSTVKDDDAYWTSDIAHDARMTTGTAHAVLKRLEWCGLVERIVRGGAGHPTSWRRTPEGRAAISTDKTMEA